MKLHENYDSRINRLDEAPKDAIDMDYIISLHDVISMSTRSSSKHILEAFLSFFENYPLYWITNGSFHAYDIIVWTYSKGKLFNPNGYSDNFDYDHDIMYVADEVIRFAEETGEYPSPAIRSGRYFNKEEAKQITAAELPSLIKSLEPKVLKAFKLSRKSDY